MIYNFRKYNRKPSVNSEVSKTPEKKEYYDYATLVINLTNY